MKVARLNENSIAIFAAWLEALKSGGSLLAPTALLGNAQGIESLPVDIHVEERGFASRYEVAEYLNDRFSSVGLVDVERDRGLWAWLSLFYIDVVCPPGERGLRKPGEIARHIPETGNFRRYYRHLLSGPYLIYRAYRDNPRIALSLLCQPVDKPGEIVAQLAARQELVTNKAIVALATRLYVDCSTGLKKRGSEGKGRGSPRRLSDVFEQFELTWDLYAATDVELASVLPKEFAKFLA